MDKGVISTEETHATEWEEYVAITGKCQEREGAVGSVECLKNLK